MTLISPEDVSGMAILTNDFFPANDDNNSIWVAYFTYYHITKDNSIYQTLNSVIIYILEKIANGLPTNSIEIKIFFLRLLFDELFTWKLFSELSRKQWFFTQVKTTTKTVIYKVVFAYKMYLNWK